MADGSIAISLATPTTMKRWRVLCVTLNVYETEEQKQNFNVKFKNRQHYHHSKYKIVTFTFETDMMDYVTINPYWCPTTFPIHKLSIVEIKIYST